MCRTLGKQSCRQDNANQTDASEQGFSHAFLSSMLIRPGHSRKHSARADGQELRCLHSCSSEHAKMRKCGAEGKIEISTANEKSEPQT